MNRAPNVSLNPCPWKGKHQSAQRAHTVAKDVDCLVIPVGHTPFQYYSPTHPSVTEALCLYCTIVGDCA